jgi:hypothetical protein
MSCEFSSSGETKRGYVAYLSEKTGLTKLREIEYAVVNGRATFEGDIVINPAGGVVAAEAAGARRLAIGEPPNDPARPRAGEVVESCVIIGTGRRWPNAEIPYTIHASLTNQARVTDAIAHWHANTPVRFRLRAAETEYVTFYPDPSGCASMVGRQGGQQGIWLAGGCSTGNTIHEIGHTVGLWHEQSREDRGSHVTLHYENIIAGYEHNFNQHIADGDDVGSYDYGSIMHYPRDAFSKNGLDTITPPAGVTLGQRTALSSDDVMGVVYMYGLGVPYVGNRRTRELHIPGCHWLGLMAAGNKINFRTPEEARASGYNGCWYCNRYWDTG